MYEATLAFAALCFLFVCGYYWRSPAFSIFHPLTFYLAFHGLLFVVRPIIAWFGQYEQIYRAYEFYPSMSDKITVILASTLGMIVFASFSLLAGNAPLRFAEDEASREERRQLTRIFAWVLAICGPLAAYSLINSYGENSNLSGLVLDRSTGVSINTTTIGYITDLQMMAVPLCALILWLARFRLWAFAPLAAFVVLRAGTGIRGPMVAAAVAAGLFYAYDKKIRYPGLKTILAAALLLSFFSLVGADRGASVRQAIGLEEQDAFVKSERKERFLEGMDFGNMEYFEYLVYAIPQRTGTYNYFLNNLQVFTEPVPRKFWPGKPIGEPFPQFSLYDYGYPIGMTRSLPGEGWYSLGWLGVVLWCGLWGYLLGRFYNSFARGKPSTFRIAAYLTFLPILVVGLRDGTSLTFVRQAGVYLMPVFIWYLGAKYLGVPSARELRSALALRRTRASNTDPNADATARRPARRLPAAVRRRRAALDTPSTPAPAE